MMDDLDRLLDHAATPRVLARLERRILADFDRLAARPSFARVIRRLADTVWPDAPVWQPACALVLALLIGAGAAILAPVEAAQADDLFTTQPDSGPQEI